MRTQENQPRSSFYMAVVVYEATSGSPQHPPLFEECFFLVHATSEDEAKEKARTFALKEEGSYQNIHKETITWRLKLIVDVSEVLYESFEDGTQLYARHFHNYEAYCSFEPLLSGGMPDEEEPNKKK